MTTYTTTQDYIDQNITPGLGDVELTDEQAMQLAHRMTSWWFDYDEIQCEGGIRYEYRSVLVERKDRDFWEELAKILGDI